jgi:hypothetical protein
MIGAAGLKREADNMTKAELIEEVSRVVERLGDD